MPLLEMHWQYLLSVYAINVLHWFLKDRGKNKFIIDVKDSFPYISPTKEYYKCALIKHQSNKAACKRCFGNVFHWRYGS